MYITVGVHSSRSIRNVSTSSSVSPHNSVGNVDFMDIASHSTVFVPSWTFDPNFYINSVGDFIIIYFIIRKLPHHAVGFIR